MKIQCESCAASGHVGDEAMQRAILWVCGVCGVRYLVSSRGMRRAPMPPPPPATKRAAVSPPPVPSTTVPLPPLPPPPSDVKPAAVPSSPPPLPAQETRPESPPENVTVAPKPLVPQAHPAAYPVMSVPVSDPLWRRPALLASALAGLLVGLAAYGVQWTRERVQAYEPSVATAAAAREPAPEIAPSATVVVSEEPAESREDVVEEPTSVPSGAVSSPSQVAVSSAKPAPKHPPARALRSKPPRPSRTTEAPEPAAPVAAAVATEPEPEVEAPRPQPTTIAEAMAEAVASEPQAKTQPPAAGPAEREGYTPFNRDSAVSALAAAAKSAARCRSDAGPFGAARVAVTFAPNGNTTTAVVEGPPFAGTPVGSCIARTFREARVSPFTGAPVTVRKSVTIF